MPLKLTPAKLELTPIAQLRPHPRNPRRGDVAAIQRSIQTNGWYGALIAQRSTGYILAGNHRFLAAQREGAVELPVLWLDIPDAQALRILLADNRANDLARYDAPALARLLRAIQDETHTLAGTLFDNASLDKLLENLTGQLAEDQSAELPSKFQILVECSTEEAQTHLLKAFLKQGLDCRALVA